MRGECDGQLQQIWILILTKVQKSGEETRSRLDADISDTNALIQSAKKCYIATPQIIRPLPPLLRRLTLHTNITQTNTYFANNIC